MVSDGKETDIWVQHMKGHAFNLYHVPPGTHRYMYKYVMYMYMYMYAQMDMGAAIGSTYTCTCSIRMLLVHCSNLTIVLTKRHTATTYYDSLFKATKMIGGNLMILTHTIDRSVVMKYYHAPPHDCISSIR